MWTRTDQNAPTSPAEREARLGRLGVSAAVRHDIAATAGDDPPVGQLSVFPLLYVIGPFYALFLFGLPWVLAKKSAERHGDGLFATTLLFPALATFLLIVLAARSYAYHRRDRDTDAKAVAQQLCSGENIIWNRLRLWLATASMAVTADDLLFRVRRASRDLLAGMCAALLGMLIVNETIEPSALLRTDGKIITASPIWPLMQPVHHEIANTNRLTLACKAAKGGGRLEFILDIGDRRFDLGAWSSTTAATAGKTLDAAISSLPRSIEKIERAIDTRCYTANSRIYGNDVLRRVFAR